MIDRMVRDLPVEGALAAMIAGQSFTGRKVMTLLPSKCAGS